MSFQIDTAFSKQYKDTITLLVQQGGSRLRDSVRNEVQIGEKPSGNKLVQPLPS